MTAQSPVSSRGEVLKKLRERYSESVTRTQALYKEQRQIQNEICKAIRDNPRTVPEVAAITGLPTNIVLWYITAFKKYGLVMEAGMCGDYPLYRKAEDA